MDTERNPLCPYDVLDSPDYAGTYPPPKGCSKKASELCCLYFMGSSSSHKEMKCDGSIDPEKTTLDADGLALMAYTQNNANMVRFLRRYVSEKMHGKYVDASKEEDFANFAY